MSGPSSTPSGWTLAFELSNPTSGGADASSIAIGRGAEVIAAEHVARSPARSTEDDLFPAIERLLARAGVGVRGLAGGRIAVSVGPGGYTGLRVACAAAKTLAEAVGARCVSVPTALVALQALSAEERARIGAGKCVAVALASKSDSAWVFVEGEADAATGRFITGENAAAFAAEHDIGVLVSDSHLPGAVRAACVGAGVAVEPPRLSAGACLAASVGMAAIDPALLVPLYAREPDAVTLWRARHG